MENPTGSFPRPYIPEENEALEVTHLTALFPEDLQVLPSFAQ